MAADQKTPRTRQPSVTAQLQVQVAVLENRMDRLEQDFVTLSKDVKDGFQKTHEALDALKNKNSVSDFIKENWKIIVVLVGIVVGGDAYKIAQLVLPSLLGGQ